MPTNQGILVTCPCCEHTGRSDNVKKHIKIVHSKALPAGWIVSSLPNVILKETSRVEEELTIKIYRDCLCTSCGLDFKNPNTNKTCMTMSHSCKPKVQRNRDYSVRTQKSTNTETKDPPQTKSTVCQEMIMKLPQKLSKFKNLTESQAERRDQLLASLTQAIEDFTDNDVINYELVMQTIFFDMASDLITQT